MHIKKYADNLANQPISPFFFSYLWDPTLASNSFKLSPVPFLSQRAYSHILIDIPPQLPRFFLLCEALPLTLKKL